MRWLLRVDEATERILVAAGAAAALLMAVLSLRAAFVAAGDINVAKLAGAAIFALLALAVVRRSRAGAALLLVYASWLRVDAFMRTGDLPAAFSVPAIALLVACALALLGAIAHHARPAARAA